MTNQYSLAVDQSAFPVSPSSFLKRNSYSFVLPLSSKPGANNEATHSLTESGFEIIEFRVC